MRWLASGRASVYETLATLAVTGGTAVAAAMATCAILTRQTQIANVTGGYFFKCKPAEPSALARDDRAAARLRTLSEGLAGLNS
jgi:hypothetical protein